MTMLYTGTNIRHSQIERLKPITIELIAEQIRNADSYLCKQIRDIRDALVLDKKLATELKKTLPYFIGASFKENLRKSENFISISYFTLDFDNCTGHSNINQVLDGLKKDNRVLLLFRSPSGTGLKCVFRLSAPFNNSMQFSNFFKSFGADFAAHHDLKDYLDFQTSDVTRVCFISADPDCFFNPDAEGVATPEVFSLANANKVDEQPAEADDEKSKAQVKKEIPADIYKKIAATLDPKYKESKPKQIYVPEELNYAVPIITEAVKRYDFQIKDVCNINYGKKITFLHGLALGELNVYYGKNGFQVVKSCRNGVHKDFTDLLHQIVSAELGMLNQTTIALKNNLYAS